MKQLLKLTLMLLLLPLNMQAQDKSSIQKMDSMALVLYGKDDFKKCAEVLCKQQALMEKQEAQNDSAYFKNLRFQARCYWRLKEYDKAISTAKAAVDNWAQYQDKDDRNYALMLDNLGLYMGNMEKPDTVAALKYSLEALQRYEKFMTNDEDLAVILVHVAENSFYGGKKEDAIKYELRALNIIKDLEGEHSDFYLSELDYLATYYEGNGMQKKAQEVSDRLEKLKNEKDDEAACLPPMMKFKTQEECKKHAKDAYQYANYYLSHLLTADKMNEVAGYVLNWSQVTDLVQISIGSEEGALFQEKYLAYGVAYMAACSKYALETDSAEFSKDMYRHALVDMLDFYDGGNKDITGKVPFMEKLLQEYNKKGANALIALIDKHYARLMEEVEKYKKNVNNR